VAKKATFCYNYPMNKNSLPEFFRPILWSYDFERLDIDRDCSVVVLQAINYGDFKHWIWLKQYFGIERLRQILQSLPTTAFRKPALNLASVVFNLKQPTYAPRSIATKTS
jgi:hypothetical protein